MHPFGTGPMPGAMALVRGTGLLSQVIEHGESAGSCTFASSPGVCDRRRGVVIGACPGGGNRRHGECDRRV